MSFQSDLRKLFQMTEAGQVKAAVVVAIGHDGKARSTALTPLSPELWAAIEAFKLQIVIDADRSRRGDPEGQGRPRDVRSRRKIRVTDFLSDVVSAYLDGQLDEFLGGR